MALIDLKFYSEALQMQAEVLVAMPQKATQGEIGVSQNTDGRKYRCLYLLHGLSDDHSIWLRRTSIERYATEKGLCVVMPCGHRSFYMDLKSGEKYYTYIAEELPRIIGEFFNVSDQREDNFIAGNSMGGYGALKIGLKNSHRFSAAAGLSSVADVSMVEFEGITAAQFGPRGNIPKDEDLFFLAEANAKNPQKPRLYMGIGTEDFMYQDNLRLKKHFEDLGYDLRYRDSAGNHNWAFWDEYIQYVIDWLLEQ